MNYDSKELTELYKLVSVAIYKAETLSARGMKKESVPLWAEVADLEEKISALVPYTDLEGKEAREGAVMACVRSEQFNRAIVMCNIYAAEQPNNEQATGLFDKWRKMAEKAKERYEAYLQATKK